LALTSPTSGSRLVGIVRSRTKATEFRFFYITWLDPWRPTVNEYLKHLAGEQMKMRNYTVQNTYYTHIKVETSKDDEKYYYAM
jgi:hypothetical protein